MANLLRGAPLAARVEDDVKARAAALAAAGRPVRLVAVRANQDPASDLYLKRQREAAERLGLSYRVEDVAPRADAVRAALRRLAADPETTGVILQTPLPPDADAAALVAEIPPDKDVEAVHPARLGRLFDGRAPVVPCTAGAVMECLAATGVPLAGAEAVVVGRSRTVGRPAALLLTERDATVTLCHSKSRDLATHLRRADVVVLAVGRVGVLTPAATKPGAVVVDVGVNRVVRDGKTVTVGDADPAVADVAGWFTPTPGGVGPVTVALLWRNAVALVDGREAAR